VSITTDLAEIRARYEMAQANPTRWGLASANDVLFLLDLVDELRRQVNVWKGKAE